jgi:hypothetical protein
LEKKKHGQLKHVIENLSIAVTLLCKINFAMPIKCFLKFIGIELDTAKSFYKKLSMTQHFKKATVDEKFICLKEENNA